MSESSRSKSAEVGLQSALLYMYAAYTEDEKLSPEQAKEKIKKTALNELNRLQIKVEGQPTTINTDNKFVVADLRKNIGVLKNNGNIQIRHIAGAIEFAINKLIGDSKLK